METTPVTFENVTIHRATILPKTGEWRTAALNSDYSIDVDWLLLFICLSISGSVQLEVRLMLATNKFEISENGNLAVSGMSIFVVFIFLHQIL